jgi:hypothetical protein
MHVLGRLRRLEGDIKIDHEERDYEHRRWM